MDAPTSLFEVIAWVTRHGRPKAEKRLGLALGLLCVKERIIFSRVNASTKVSADLLQAAKDAACKIVGRALPESSNE